MILFTKTTKVVIGQLRSLSVLLFMLLFSHFGVFAQQWTSGNCTMGIATNTYAPNSVTTAGATSRHAIIYQASQGYGCLAGTTLNTIYMNRYSGTIALSGTPNLKIYLQETANTDWGAGSLDWATAISTAILVYDGDPTSIIGTTTGWKAFPMSSSFAVSAGQNLAVFMEYSNAAASAGSAGWEYEYTTPCVNTGNSNTTKYITNTTGVLGATLSSTNYRRPLIGFDYTGTPASQTYGSSTTTQSSTATLVAGATNQQIIRV